MGLKYERTQGFVMRHGRRIDVDHIAPVAVPSSKPKRSFHAKWVKLPRHWISSLGNSKSANTYRVALLILQAAYEDKRGTGEVVLSAAMVLGMSRETRRRAVRELAELGLIAYKQIGQRAFRIKPLV
jgi:hypothetical protein